MRGMRRSPAVGQAGACPLRAEMPPVMKGGGELDDLDAFQRRFVTAYLSGPALARDLTRQMRRSLSRRTRLRLRCLRLVDTAAYWLACHDHCDAARRLYQLTGLWS